MISIRGGDVATPVNGWEQKRFKNPRFPSSGYDFFATELESAVCVS